MCRCANFPVKFVFINPTFCVGSGVHLFQGWFCMYTCFINEAPGLLLSGPKSSFQIKVNFTFHLEIMVWRKTGEAQKSSVKFPKSVMIWGDFWHWSIVLSKGIKSKVNATIYQEILEHLCFNLLTSFMEMLISFLSRTFTQCQTHFQGVY